MKRSLAFLALSVAFLCPSRGEEIFTGKTPVTAGAINLTTDRFVFLDADTDLLGNITPHVLLTDAAGTYFLSPAATAAAYQPLDADLTAWAGVTSTANGRALVSAADYAAMRGLLDLEAGTDFLSVAAIAAAYQGLDADLTDLADGSLTGSKVGTGISGDNITSGTVADARIASTITRDGEAITGSVAAGTVVASGFNGNLTTTDDTVQEIAQKLDDLTVGAGADFDALAEATESDIASTDVMAVSDAGTEKKISLANLRDFLQSLSWVFSSMTVTDLDTTNFEIGGVAVTPTAAELNHVDGVTSPIQTQLDAKAPLASPPLTGTPTAPTATAGDDDTSIATTAYVQDEVDTTAAGTHASPNTGAETPTWTGPTHIVWQGDAATVNLPAAAGYASRGIIIYSTAASILTVEPNGSEVIVRDGTAQTGGVNFTLSAAAGNYVALVSDGVRWVTLGFKGTLAVGS